MEKSCVYTAGVGGGDTAGMPEVFLLIKKEFGGMKQDVTSIRFFNAKRLPENTGGLFCVSEKFLYII